jgi:hypothetical protein
MVLMEYFPALFWDYAKSIAEKMAGEEKSSVT